MSSKGDKKRKHGKAFYLSGGKKRRYNPFTLEIGMKGFLITCNGYEKQCVQESYNLLNEYADTLYGQEKKDNSDSEDDDVDVALEKEIASLKKKTSPGQRRFQVIESGANNCIIIRTTIDDPCHLVYHILQDTASSQVLKSRHIQRFLPISGVCRADVVNISQLVLKLSEPYFKQSLEESATTEESDATCYASSSRNQTMQVMDCLQTDIVKRDSDTIQRERDVILSESDIHVAQSDSGIVHSDNDNHSHTNDKGDGIAFRKVGSSYCVIFKARNSNMVTRDSIIAEVTSVIMSHSSKNYVDLKNPDYAIIVEVIRSKCCISVVQDYFKLKKYNLHELAVTKNLSDKTISLLDKTTEYKKE